MEHADLRLPVCISNPRVKRISTPGTTTHTNPDALLIVVVERVTVGARTVTHEHAPPYRLARITTLNINSLSDPSRGDGRGFQNHDLNGMGMDVTGDGH